MLSNATNLESTLCLGLGNLKPKRISDCALCEARLCRMVREMMPEEYTAYNNQFKTLLKEGTSSCCQMIAFPRLFFCIEELLRLITKQLNYASVHDASATCKSYALEKGPNLLPLL